MPRVKTMFQSWTVDDQTLKQLKAESSPYCGKPKDQLKKMHKDNSVRIISFASIEQLAEFDASVRKDRATKCHVGDRYFVRKRFDQELLMVFEEKIRFEEPARRGIGRINPLMPVSPPAASACHL